MCLGGMIWPGFKNDMVLWFSERCILAENLGKGCKWLRCEGWDTLLENTWVVKGMVGVLLKWHDWKTWDVLMVWLGLFFKNVSRTIINSVDKYLENTSAYSGMFKLKAHMIWYTKYHKGNKSKAIF